MWAWRHGNMLDLSLADVLAEKTRQLRRSLKQCKPVSSLPSVLLVRQLVTSRLVTASILVTHICQVCVMWRGTEKGWDKEGKAGRQEKRQQGAICWPKGERTRRRFERDKPKTIHQMQDNTPASQSLTNRTYTWRRLCFFPGTGLSSQVTSYSFCSNDHPPHYQLQRAGTVLEISVVVHQPTRLRPNTSHLSRHAHQEEMSFCS